MKTFVFNFTLAVVWDEMQGGKGMYGVRLLH